MPRAPKNIHPESLTPAVIAAWNEVLEVAVLFRDMAPWRWIHGSSILGVRDLRSGQIDWCSVLGQGGQTFGVAIYSGDAGLGSMQRTYENCAGEFDAMIQQTAQVVTFLDRDWVSPDMVAIIKACGRRYRGANAWPELLVHEPGYYPAPPLDVHQLQRIASVLETLLHMCARPVDIPDWDMHDAHNRPWVATQGPGREIALERVAMPKIPAPPVPIISVNEVLVAKIRAQGRHNQLIMLMDWFMSTSIIDEPPGRPFLAAHVTAFSAENGMILDIEIGRLETVWQDMAALLLKLVADNGVPAQVMLRRPEGMRILAPLAVALGIELVLHPKGDEIVRDFLDHMDSFGMR